MLQNLARPARLSSRLYHSTARHPCCALDVIDSHRDSSIRLLGFRARRATSRFVRLMCSTSDSSTRPRRPCSMRRDSIRPCSTRRDSSLVYDVLRCSAMLPCLLRLFSVLASCLVSSSSLFCRLGSWLPALCRHLESGPSPLIAAHRLRLLPPLLLCRLRRGSCLCCCLAYASAPAPLFSAASAPGSQLLSMPPPRVQHFSSLHCSIDSGSGSSLRCHSGRSRSPADGSSWRSSCQG